MFQNIGWLEIFMVVVVGIIIIGPEKLPGVIQDVRAAIYAARKAINNAKKEMNGEFGEEFDEFRKPLAEVAKWRAMGPKRALTKALFDDDESFLDDFDPKKLMEEAPTAGEAHRREVRRVGGETTDRTPTVPAPRPGTQRIQLKSQQEETPPQAPQPQPAPAPRPAAHRDPGLHGGFSWGDIM
ncbi:sec-independent translocase [Corynebacterium renale]|uniref:Sec-independent protein translocase protein TatB n=1 Tax=Corynebacterium renale TaxID=1724 RepID=UPI000DA372E2|nr:Sec-independent protein translocase protein TatB [Corynebacterium renale]SQG64439.1 sec-independent translocase [Corynebacterium renale]STC95276.1 sec-independent translocase [Corynebacterium renale]